jgi:hypothetical protein
LHRLVQTNDAVAIGKWERPNQHGVDDGEDRRVGAYAERERDEGDEREPGMSEQGAQREPDVAPEIVGEREAARVADFFLIRSIDRTPCG